MKVFYIIAVLVATALLLSPLELIPKAQDISQQAPIIKRYDDAGQPVLVDDPAIRYDTYGGAIRSIDPTTCGDVSSSNIQGEFYEGLYGYHYLMRDRGRPIVTPQLAAAMPTISDDRTVYTIPLRDDVLYHRNLCFGKADDGRLATRKVRAEDFVLAFKRIADGHNVKADLAWSLIAGRIVGLDDFRKTTKDNYKTGDFSRFDIEVEGVKALDENTIQLTLNEPYPQLQYVLAMHLYAPCPREALDYWLAGNGEIPLEKREVEFLQPQQVVGTGAYLLRKWKRKHEIIMVRNPDFRHMTYPTRKKMLALVEDKAAGQAWLDELDSMDLLDDAGKTLPFIDGMHYRFVQEIYPAWGLFLEKQSDASGIPRAAFAQVLTPSKKLTDAWKDKGIYMRSYWNPTLYWIVFNMDDPILGASPSLRRALALSYNVESEIKLLRNGRGRRATNIVPNAFRAHDVAGPGPYYRFDLDAAKAELEKAKQELAAKGLLEKDGSIPKLKFYLADGGERSAEFTEQQFGQLGLDIESRFQDWPTLLHLTHTGQAQMFTMGWHADYYDAENFLQLFYSKNIAAGTNSSHYNNPEFDAIYEKIRSLPDSPERTELYAKAIEIVCNDCPVLMTSEPQSLVLLYKWYKNVLPHPIGVGFGKYRRIDLEMRRAMGGRN